LAANAQDTTKCQRYRLASLPITYDAGRRPTVPITVDDVQKQFLVDTGGVDSMLTQSTVDELKLSKEHTDLAVYDVTGAAIKYRTYAHSIKIGSMTAGRWPFLVMPDNNIGVGDPNAVGGVLSPDIMLKYDVEFDFGADKLNIFTHDDCSGRVTYWSAEPYVALPFRLDFVDDGGGFHIIARATLDGQDIDVQFDSGASDSVMMNDDALEVIPPQSTSLMKRLDTNPDERNAVYHYPFHTLNLDGMEIQNPEVVILPEKNGFVHNAQTRPRLIVGMTVLRKLHVYVAYREKTIYLTDANAH
jgi:predicted aspartyl protease